MTSAMATPSTRLDMFLGVAGILGGVYILVAFLPVTIWEPPAVPIRLIVWLLAAIAVIVGVHRRQAVVGGRLALVVATAAIAANALYLSRLILPLGPWHPFAGDNGWVFFYAGLVMWLADAVFGLVALRLGMVTRYGAAALAIGSLLTIVGIDRLGLTSETAPTIFGPISLTGVALIGVGWILLGLDLAGRGRQAGARQMRIS